MSAVSTLLSRLFDVRANLSSPQGVRSFGRQLFASKMLSKYAATPQRRADLSPRGTLVPHRPPFEYAPISLRRKVFEALATSCLTTETRKSSSPSPKCVLGHPISSAGMAQPAKEVDNRMPVRMVGQAIQRSASIVLRIFSFRKKRLFFVLHRQIEG